MQKLTAIFILVTFALNTVSGSPKTLNLEGALTDQGGNPLDGAYDVTFRIYNQKDGGTALWAEKQSVSVAQGLFAVQLGKNTPLNLPFDQEYWVGTEVGKDGEMRPRTPLSTAAYSFRAKSAQMLQAAPETPLQLIFPPGGMFVLKKQGADRPLFSNRESDESVTSYEVNGAGGKGGRLTIRDSGGAGGGSIIIDHASRSAAIINTDGDLEISCDDEKAGKGDRADPRRDRWQGIGELRWPVGGD